MRPTDYTGRRFGGLYVIGPAGEPRTWRTECRCGRETIRSSDALRAIKNAGGFEGCNACRVRKAPRGLKPESNSESMPIDIGHTYEDGAGFRLTALGRLQMDFYLGRMGHGPV